jgi:lysophospholipase L1-like esterase
MGLTSKTAWAAIWFAALGISSLVAVKLWLSDEAGSGGGGLGLAEVSLPPGPLPVSAAPIPEPEDEAASEPAPGLSEPQVPIEDADGRSLCGFFSALSALERGERRTVRVSHYGDSILTSDHVSGRLRHVFQERFGDAGHGFVLLSKPWRWYKHEDIKHGVRGEWRDRPLTSDPLPDGMYGLGGVASEPQRGYRNRAWVSTDEDAKHGTRVAEFDVSYLAQPGGGSFDVVVDGEVVDTVQTASRERGAAHRVIRVSPPGRAKLLIEPRNDGPLRLFGVVMESDRRGVVWDSLAINGARASVLGRFDAQHWQSELAHRDPALVVLMFGANEGHNEFLALDDYRRHLAEVIRVMRGGVPEASFLVVGPLDQAVQKPDGTFDSRRMPAKLSAVQREVALAEGCAFFDTFNAMGGRKSMGKWFRRGLGGGDLIHPTEHGSRKIGDWIAGALLWSYAQAEENPEVCKR